MVHDTVINVTMEVLQDFVTIEADSAGLGRRSLLYLEVQG